MSPRTTTAGEAARFRLLPTTRIEAFSDGVFAIVITVLVLEPEVPDASAQPRRGLAAGWAGYLGYVVSFAFIGGVWMSHAKATRFMVAADDGLMRLNLVLLPSPSGSPLSSDSSCPWQRWGSTL